VLLQGTSIPVAARRLRVDVPFVPKREYPIEYSPMRGLKSELTELIVPPDSPVAGKSIVELGLPADFLVILVARGDQFLLPSGGTTLLVGDALLALSDCDCLDQVQARFGLRRTGGAL